MSRPKCVVPLAGPDMMHPRFGLRALVAVEGEPLIRRALGTRAWREALAPEDYVFVLRDTEGADELRQFLGSAWPGCGVVLLPHLTAGALFSALAGVAVLPPDSGPVVVDLADILFDGGPDAALLRDWPAELGAVAPYFIAQDPKFSYLRITGGRVEAAVEKQVISDAASAGVYVFKDVQTYLTAAAGSLANAAARTFRDAFFVCPMFNDVVAAGGVVRPMAVTNVRPVSALFAD